MIILIIVNIIDGWTYFGRTIGTPFLTPQQEVSSSLPSRIWNCQ